MEHTDPLLTTDEVADFLKISRVTLWRRVKDGTVPKPLKVGVFSRWPRSDILSVIDAAKAARSAAA
jgi:predicted DNA-binding transcriptional regulator AlpA